MQKIIKFLKEVAVEFRNISWPKKDTLIQLTVVVISISIVISLILGGFDYLFTRSFGLLGHLNSPSLNQPAPVDQPQEVIPLPTDDSAAGQIKP